MSTAIVTGGSEGLGLAIARALSTDGWTVVVDARDGDRLRRAVRGLDGVRAVPGDVTDDGHRRALVEATGGSLDLVVHNASTLGPSPLPSLASVGLDAVADLLATNVVAPLALTQLALPSLRASARPVVVAISSDAAVEAYEGWGAYGVSKAALDHLCRVLAVEEPAVRVYAFDPGDMRTDMQQRAFPGEDISDRAEPASVVPALLRLVNERPDGVRHRAADLRAPDLRAPDLHPAHEGTAATR
ncbi:MAG: short-chain dehydrogenase/reductase [Frankiales bacterium]|nr:short-chain dehydrogenase/reductase [Frankiales bacterium]